MGKRVRMIKRIGALVLLFSFFLPLSRCETTDSYPVNEEGYTQEIPENMKQYDYFYAWEGIRDGELAAKIFIPLAFTWPLIFMFLRARVSNQVVNRGILFLEPVVAVAGAYFVFMINFLNDLYFGFYVAVLGVVCFFLGSATEIFTFIRERGRK